jgi:hypothetical protein
MDGEPSGNPATCRIDDRTIMNFADQPRWYNKSVFVNLSLSLSMEGEMSNETGYLW